MVDLTCLPANQPITPFASNSLFTLWYIVAPPGNWKQWKWKPEMENGSGKQKQSKLDANEC